MVFPRLQAMRSGVKVTFTFDSITEAAAFLQSFENKVVTEVEAAPQLTQPAEKPAQQTEAPKRGRGRPPRAAAAPKPEPAKEPAKEAAPATVKEAATEAVAPTPDKEPAAGEADPAPTPEEAMAALRAVFDTQGTEATLAVLKKFNATRIGEVKPEQYADFIAACKG